MRTTLDLPDELLEEARRLLGFKSNTDTVVFSLRELVRKGAGQGAQGSPRLDRAGHRRGGVPPPAGERMIARVGLVRLHAA